MSAKLNKNQSSVDINKEIAQELAVEENLESNSNLNTNEDIVLSEEEKKLVNIDRYRYVKNKLSSSLSLLAILLNAFYFVTIYRGVEGNNGTFYYNMLIGASVIYNLLFMLFIFLASEGVKNYKLPFSYVLIVAGVLQVVRIFILPVQANAMKITTAVNQTIHSVLSDAQFIWVILCLSISAVCLIAAGIVNIIKNGKLKKCIASLGEVE